MSEPMDSSVPGQSQGPRPEPEVDPTTTRMKRAASPTFSPLGALMKRFHPEEEEDQEEDIFLQDKEDLEDPLVILVINSLAASDVTTPPEFQEELGPAVADDADTPASPDPYGSHEGSVISMVW